MTDENMSWLLKKVVTDFRGYPIGRVKKLWVDSAEGPMVIIERSKSIKPTWEAIPIQAIDSVSEEIRLKPPTFAE
jgi:hypothetical protein